MSSDLIKYFVTWCIFKDSYRGRNTDSSVFCNKIESSRWTLKLNEKTLALYVKLNTHQQIFNRVFRCNQIVCDMVYF